MHGKKIKVRMGKRHKAVASYQAKVADTHPSRTLLPSAGVAYSALPAAREFYLGFGIRYFSVDEADFHGEVGLANSVLCHFTRSEDGHPLVFLKADVGHTVADIRALATRLLVIANDAEELSRDPRFDGCFRRY